MKQALFLSLTACILMAGCGGSSPFIGQHGNTEKNGAGKDSAFFIVAEWNVQALFDGHETGNEYAEYREISDWTEEKFMARITAISRAIQQMAAEESSPAKTDVKPAAPDLIGLVEVENSGILGKLAQVTISEYGYFWTAFSGLPLSSLGVGFLSRHPLKEVRSHSITIDGNTAPRPVLEIKVEKQGQPLVFLLCHWKSKLGDEGATEALRRASARIVRRRLRELNESEPQTPVIVMGDLNENHDEFSRNSGTPKNFYFALLPDTDDAAALVLKSAGKAAAYKDFLVLSGEKPPRALFFPMDIPALYSPWVKEMENGSYYFRDRWETIDHFLLSGSLFDGQGWEYNACRVLNHTPFSTSEGIPNPYVPRTGRGLSDHLPLLLYLTYTE